MAARALGTVPCLRPVCCASSSLCVGVQALLARIARPPIFVLHWEDLNADKVLVCQNCNDAWWWCRWATRRAVSSGGAGGRRHVSSGVGVFIVATTFRPAVVGTTLWPLRIQIGPCVAGGDDKAWDPKLCVGLHGDEV